MFLLQIFKLGFFLGFFQDANEDDDDYDENYDEEGFEPATVMRFRNTSSLSTSSTGTVL